MTTTAPPWPGAPATQPHRRPALALAALAALLGVTSLILAIVALARTPGSPSYSTAERAAAKTDLCNRHKPAMDAIHIETNGPDAGFGRTALVNGALLLEYAASNPALDPKYQDAAQAVVQAYENLVVQSSISRLGEPPFDSAVNDVNAKEHVLKELCRA